MQQPKYVGISLDELTSLQQRLSIADSEMERLTADNARYLLALRSLATWTEDAIKGGSKVVVREQPRWIPVGEKLPKWTESVIACGEDTVWTAYVECGIWKDDTTHTCIPVTHWMPLPEPPDGQS